MFRFLAIFLLLLTSLFFIELQEPIQQKLIDPFTSSLARASVIIIMLFDENVTTHGRIIQSTVNFFSVSIEAGCNGVEAAIVLFSAILAFPAKIIHKAIAVILGLITIQILNVARIISLFYLGQWNMDLFSWVHLYLWPVLIMLDVLLVFLIYLNFLSRSKE